MGEIVEPEGPTSDTCEYLKWGQGPASDISSLEAPQSPETASDITDLDRKHSKSSGRRKPTPLPAIYAAAFHRYEGHTTQPGSPLDPDTIRAYLSRVRQYLAWLEDAGIEGDPLADPTVRDWAARDYRAYLMTVAKRKPNTVNGHLTAVDDFNRHLGMGPASARRNTLPPAAPRALDSRSQIRFLREAERAPVRDRAIAYTGFYAGPRIGELAALNVDDVHLSARKGTLIIRYGKNGKYREVPIHSQLRGALDAWMLERPSTDDPALFLNHRGGRLSTRGAYDILIGLAADAGVEEFTPHVLRHTLGTQMRLEGVDVVVIAELLGHSVEVARRYTLPSEDERRAAIEKHTTDR